jgi:ubiquitin-protein ligase
MISILFLAADPTDISRLRLGEEVREIQERLQLAKSRENFVLHQRFAVRPADISQSLLDLTPTIVHFSGHGMSTGAICVENQLGETQPIKPEDLAALLEQFSAHVKCVVLNACYSEAQARGIARHIDNVIGMSTAIDDRAAIAFSTGFYQALGAGRSIEDAYKLGCVQIRLQGIPEHSTPVLLKKRTSAKLPDPIKHRLEADSKHLQDMIQNTSSIEIVKTEGKPPISYLLKFAMDGIVGIDYDENPRIGKEHLVEIRLHDDYPMSLPFVRFTTPMFHPNIFANGNACLGWFHLPYELPDVCVRIAQMIDYQVYDLISIADLRAAKWAKTHSSLFPLANWNLTRSKASMEQVQFDIRVKKEEKINIDLLLLTTGHRYNIRVATDMGVGKFKLKLIEELGLPRKFENEWPAEYVLENRTQNRRLQDHLTLRENKVQDGDTLIFTVSATAG